MAKYLPMVGGIPDDNPTQDAELHFLHDGGLNDFYVVSVGSDERSGPKKVYSKEPICNVKQSRRPNLEVNCERNPKVIFPN